MKPVLPPKNLYGGLLKKLPNRSSVLRTACGRPVLASKAYSLLVTISRMVGEAKAWRNIAATSRAEATLPISKPDGSIKTVFAMPNRWAVSFIDRERGGGGKRG